MSILSAMKRRIQSLIAFPSWTLTFIFVSFAWCLILLITTYSNSSSSVIRYQDRGLHSKSELSSTYQIKRNVNNTNNVSDLQHSFSMMPTTSLASSLPEKIKRKEGNEVITIAAVTCGISKVEETLTMVKSAIFVALRFKLPSLQLHLFADNDTQPTLNSEITATRDQISGKGSLVFQFEIHPIVFPTNLELRNWGQDLTILPCTTQRLLFPTMAALSKVDKLLYVDTDVIFVRDLREIWAFFSLMNPSQHTALAPEHEVQSWAWYGVSSRTPFYPPLGLNAGVMLMNLPRQRAFGWEQKVIQYYTKYKKHLRLADQDVLNIIFHFHPESLYVLPCAFNYRGGPHCLETGHCPSAQETGVRLMHGIKPSNFQYPSFKAVYMAFKNFDLQNDDVEKNLYKPLYQELDTLSANVKVKDDCRHLILFLFLEGIESNLIK